MQKIQKESLVGDVRKLVEQNSVLLVVKHNALTVAESCFIRAEVKKIGSCYKVIKNTLMTIALDNTQFDSLKESLVGQTAIVFSNSPADIAKLMCDFAKKYNEKLEVVAGCYNGEFLSADKIELLAKLPSLDVLRSKVIALIRTPSQNIYSCVKAPVEKIVRVLKAHVNNNN